MCTYIYMPPFTKNLFSTIYYSLYIYTTNYKTIIFYWAQSKEPWFHSWPVPPTRTNNNKYKVALFNTTSDWSSPIKNGNNNTNSTSKIKNTNVRRKNRIENGNRALCLGVNPHSKGLIFSWATTCFIARLPHNTIRTLASTTTLLTYITNSKILNASCFT